MKTFKIIKCSHEGCNVSCKSGKRGFCPKHYALLIQSRAAARKKTKSKQIKVTKKAIESQRKGLSKKLDILFSKLVKQIYPFVCHGKCQLRRLRREEAQCCHFVGRRKVLLRWFLGNALPGCAKCNLSDQDHVYFLGVYLNKYYGDGFAEEVSNAGKRNTVKLDLEQLQLMYDTFSEALDYIKTLDNLSYNDKKGKLEQLRLDIINKTKFF